MTARRLLRLCPCAGAIAVVVGRVQAQATASVVTAQIGRLGDLDYARRTALIEAVSKNPDGHVRFRAFVLLAGFNDPRTADLARSMLGDRNDRLRKPPIIGSSAILTPKWP